MRYAAFAAALVATVAAALLTVVVSAWWTLALLPFAFVAAVGLHDVVQTRHSVLRTYPLLGHFRYGLEDLRPELQQYFVERDRDGAPFHRVERSLVYERAKEVSDQEAFGTELDVYRPGASWLVHSIEPVDEPVEPHRVRIGDEGCGQPYDIALLNVSAMSFGALSANAVLALNEGARRGDFAQDTGEGGLSQYHLRPGGDLIWEIGSGYFGCRHDDGSFDVEQFTDRASEPAVKCISIKLSQGAKPGVGGVMPAAKMTEEIARARGVPADEACVSPPSHSAFSGPRGLLEFVALLRERSGGKPTGMKLCVGSRTEIAALCKAMLVTGIRPDFVIVDGSEGGTGAGPVEFADHVGTPLTEGLAIVTDALVGCGVRDRVRVGASGKITSGSDIVKRLAQGADFTLAARAMMMALGCIQAQRCHTGTCPVGVTTQDPRRMRSLVVADKAERVHHYQRDTVRSANRLIASMGLSSPQDLGRHHLMVRDDRQQVRSFAELHPPLSSGELLGEPPSGWADAWTLASADRFRTRPLTSSEGST